MDVKAVLADLDRALTHENTLSIYYPAQAEVLTGLDGLQVAEMLKEDAGESAGHAAKLRARIVALGGTPSAIVKPMKRVKSAKEALRQALKMEREALELYGRLLHSIPKHSHFLLYETIEEILEEEAESVEELERLV